MVNKWMIILGLWIIVIGLCYYFVDKTISFMMIACIVAGCIGVGAFIVNNIYAAKHRNEIK